MLVVRTILTMFVALGASLAAPAAACSFQPFQAGDDTNARSELPAFWHATDTAIGENFPGEVILFRGGMNYIMREAIACESNDWPWASVSKQVIATLVMQEVERGTLALDAPVISYLRLPPAGDTPSPTVRQLLQHRSGLRNPEDSPAGADGLPSFYTDGPHGVDWCLAERTAPPAEGWSYNNCDYILLGKLLEKVTGHPSLTGLVNERLREANAGQIQILPRRQRSLARYDEGFPIDISRYGASGAVIGTLDRMIAFDRALMDGRLLSEESLATMWDGDPALGYMALGQWAFEVELNDCEAPVRIIERRGAILDYQVRNLVVPDRDIALAIAVRDENLEFGELWQRSGKSYDILSAAVCGEGA